MTYNTVKRSELIKFLSENGGQAFSVDDICSRILVNGCGKSTVYRLISKLSAEGLVRRIFDGKTRSATYQYVNTGSCSEHFHLKCNDCGKIIHLDGVTSNILETRILKTEGFSLEGGILLWGKCFECRAQHEKEGAEA